MSLSKKFSARDATYPLEERVYSILVDAMVEKVEETDGSKRDVDL